MVLFKQRRGREWYLCTGNQGQDPCATAKVWEPSSHLIANTSHGCGCDMPLPLPYHDCVVTRYLLVGPTIKGSTQMSYE